MDAHMARLSKQQHGAHRARERNRGNQTTNSQPGDLDRSVSQHHLTTLKSAYVRLRYLADAGAVFVGHGLKSDFRMMNLTVPSAQV